MIKLTFTWEGAARKLDRRELQNVYYDAIYGLLQTPIEHSAKATNLKELKAKITRLHHEQQRCRHLNKPVTLSHTKNPEKTRVKDSTDSVR
jgi:hypothetical protein